MLNFTKGEAEKVEDPGQPITEKQRADQFLEDYYRYPIAIDLGKTVEKLKKPKVRDRFSTELEFTGLLHEYYQSLKEDDTAAVGAKLAELRTRAKRIKHPVLRSAYERIDNGGRFSLYRPTTENSEGESILTSLKEKMAQTGKVGNVYLVSKDNEGITIEEYTGRRTVWQWLAFQFTSGLVDRKISPLEQAREAALSQGPYRDNVVIYSTQRKRDEKGKVVRKKDGFPALELRIID